MKNAACLICSTKGAFVDFNNDHDLEKQVKQYPLLSLNTPQHVRRAKEDSVQRVPMTLEIRWLHLMSHLSTLLMFDIVAEG